MMRRKRRKKRRSEEEIKDIKEELKIIAYILFRAAEIIAIILLCRYIYETNKPPTTLHPNDWDLPVVIEQVTPTTDKSSH